MPSVVSKPQTRRDRYREETRTDLSRFAFNLAKSRGLANVRVPEIAAAAGVSTRTFNNYFSSKEEAVVWYATAHAGQLADALRNQPADMPLRDALIAAMKSIYETSNEPQELQTLIKTEPALYGEYLKASSAAEQALANTLIERMGETFTLDARILAAMITGAENVAISQWSLRQNPAEKLVDIMTTSMEYALAGLEGKS